MRHAWRLELTATLAIGLIAAQPAVPGHVTDAVDVKVTLDNPGLSDPVPDPLPEPTPGFDAQNQSQQNPSLAISPVDPAILAVVANDARMFVPPPLALWRGSTCPSTAARLGSTPSSQASGRIRRQPDLSLPFGALPPRQRLQ